MKKTLFISIVSAFLLFSCTTDFEINADWKETMVVYGLLSQNDNIHYIKINKAFLGKDNALVMAQNPDSSSYGNEIEVRIEEWKNGNQNKVWYLDTTTIYNKEPGVFYSPKQVLYKFSATLDAEATYKLFIKNKKNGKIVSSQTELVRTFSINNPSGPQQVNFVATSNVMAKWTTAKYAKLYEIVVRFTYLEINNSTQDSALKTLDWKIGSYKSEDIDGGSSMIASYYGPSFFNFLHDNIPVNPDVKRVVSGYPLEFIFSAAANEFNTYLEVNAPTTGIAQEKPQYTNISNGIGLFSSRYQKITTHFMNANSRDTLYYGHNTKDLNFQ